MLNGSSVPIDIQIFHHVSAGETHPYIVIRPKDVAGDLSYAPSR
jgi:hypothetical protein